MPPYASSTPRDARNGDARARAAEVLARVDHDGAFAAAALDAALDRAPPLDARDRGLTTELVYGVLRTVPALDAALGQHARNGVTSLAALDPYARAVIRIGAYQVLALARVPPRAAVHAAVEALKRSRSARLAGFANAVLRKLSDARPEVLADDARLRLALDAVPTSVRTRIEDVLGVTGAQDFLSATLGRGPSMGLRVTTGRITRTDARTRLEAEVSGAVVTFGTVSPLALRVEGGGDLTRARMYTDGLVSVQEEGAQAVALAAGVQPGMRVLDACAGRGGKSAVFAQALAGHGTLHAVDLSPEKLARLRDELLRAGVSKGLSVETAGADLTRGIGALARVAPPEGYDVALVDAPCSGLGTLARRPDLLGRLRDAVGWKALTVLQRAILDVVARQVAVGGVLVYAVCTLNREEGDDVVDGFVAAHPEFASAEGGETVPAVLRPPRVVLRTDVHGTDGFMVFRLRRQG